MFYNILIEILEKKGTIRILLLLLENQDNLYSKYELEKFSKLSNLTLIDRLKDLKEVKLVEETQDVGPRARTEINLTPLGREIAELLAKINEKMNI